MDEPLLENLLDWLRIPSISTGEGDPADLRRAAEHVCELVRAAGGEAALDERFAGNPIATGLLKTAGDDAPTVLIYGHYDVQSVGDPGAWTTPPFEPQIRDGRIYARGAADDKGNFLPLLHEACALAREGLLPVNVRVLVEGEEECGGSAVAQWVAADRTGADAAIVMDSGMEDERTPAITIGLRGFVMGDLRVRCQPRDLHSGIYGGSVLNAAHVLHGALAAILPDENGDLRPELREGIEPASDEELASWAQLRGGDEVLGEVGAQPLNASAGADYRRRNGADASLELNLIEAGEARTIVPAQARAVISMRLAPRQDPERMRDVLERLLRERLPQGAELEAQWMLASPALTDAAEPAVVLARAAIERATGMSCALTRSGGSIPVVADLAARGIPVIVTGFAVAADDIHAPDESFRLESLELGQRASRELLLALAELQRA